MLTTYRANKRDYLNLMNTQLGGNYKGYIYIYHGPTTLRDDYIFVSMGEFEINDRRIRSYLETDNNYLNVGSYGDPIEKTINEKSMQYYLVVMKDVDSEPSSSWISGIDLSGARSFHQVTTGVDLGGLMKINYMDKLNSDKPFNLYVVSKKYTDKYPNIPIYNIDNVKEELRGHFGKPKPAVESSLPKPIPVPEPVSPLVRPSPQLTVTASNVITEIYRILDEIERVLGSSTQNVSLGCSRINYVITSYQGILQEYIKDIVADCKKETDQGRIFSMIESINKIADYNNAMKSLNIPKESRNILSDEAAKMVEEINSDYRSDIKGRIIEKINKFTREN